MNDPIDYTVLPVGTTTPDGPIVECPYCRRNGAETEVNGMPFYIHKLLGAVINGQFQMNDDSCPQTPNDLESV